MRTRVSGTALPSSQRRNAPESSGLQFPSTCSGMNCSGFPSSGALPAAPDVGDRSKPSSGNGDTARDGGCVGGGGVGELPLREFPLRAGGI